MGATEILIGVVCLVVFIWIFFVPSKKPWTASEIAKAEESHMIGVLVGAMGGDITQAAVARYALERFEQQYQCKATTNDLGLLLGIISSGV